MPNSDSESNSEKSTEASSEGAAVKKAGDPRWEVFRQSLLRRRDELIDALADYKGKAREASPDPIKDGLAETATESFQRDQLLGAVSLDQETLDEVNAALGRIEAGTYGICEATGQPIPLERLREIPWTRFSVEAQREMEAQGKRPGIGPLGSFDSRPAAVPFADATMVSTESEPSSRVPRE